MIRIIAKRKDNKQTYRTDSLTLVDPVGRIYRSGWKVHVVCKLTSRVLLFIFILYYTRITENNASVMIRIFSRAEIKNLPNLQGNSSFPQRFSKVVSFQATIFCIPIVPSLVATKFRISLLFL